MQISLGGVRKGLTEILARPSRMTPPSSPNLTVTMAQDARTIHDGGAWMSKKHRIRSGNAAPSLGDLIKIECWLEQSVERNTDQHKTEKRVWPISRCSVKC